MNIRWKIKQIWVKPVDGNLTNVVVTAAWRCIGEQISDGETYSGTCYGTASFAPADPTAFVPFVNLTEAEVLDWVWASGVDKQAAEDIIAAQIATLINPPVVTLHLPWINSPSD